MQGPEEPGMERFLLEENPFLDLFREDQRGQPTADWRKKPGSITVKTCSKSAGAFSSLQGDLNHFLEPDPAG